MTYALIENDTVVMIDLTPNPSPNFVEVPDFVQPGYVVVNGEFVLPSPPDPPMPVLTQRQFWLAAFTAGVTEANVVALAEQIQDVEEREWMLIEIRKAQDYKFEHPAVETLRQMMGLPIEQFKTLWKWAATL